MIYIRGNRADYDGWAAAGHAGWGYDDLLAYFKRAEDNARGADDLHGAGGPLRVSEGRSRNPIAAAFIEAAVEAGFARNDDFNGPDQDGVGWYQATQRDGRRCSAAMAYLHPVADRPNLEIRTSAQAHRILVEDGRAVGVAGERFGEPFEVRADREVLVCGGAYHSPALLQLSGIGDPDELALREIACVHELPEVGRNLSDHLVIGLQYAHDEPVSLLAAALDAETHLAQFTQSGTGSLTSTIAESGGFFRTGDDQPAPDMQFHTIPALFPDEGLGDGLEHGVTLSVCLLNPESRGRVTLASAEPSAKPRIAHEYLSAGRDAERLVAGLRRLIEVSRQPALAPYCKRPVAAPDGDGDAELLAHIRRHAQTIYHPVGTCAMGTVVDDELRVLGLDGLRVVDCSVMPTVPRGNTNAPVIAVAERAADLIAGVAWPEGHSDIPAFHTLPG
jgi:choline dehydrogenase